MATGKQHVKTPSGWNATQGAWVKTGGTTWKAAEQIYVKTGPSTWNNASGQTSVQQPYPYIANSQSPSIANAQQPYPYIANAQTPSIANAQQPYPYIANSQTPSIENAQQPYPYPANAQSPSIANAQQPYPYIANAQSPSIANAQQPYPYIANARQPGTYRNPFTYRVPYIANARQPGTYRHPFTYRVPYIANARNPFTYRNPYTYRVPYIANARSPFTYRNPYTYRVPYIANARTPATYQVPFTYQASARQPQSYPYGGGGFQGGGGCFIAGTQIWMANNTYTNIENVVVGDSVMTYCFDHNKLMPQNVTEVMVPREGIRVFNVELSNGKTLGVTGGHPIHTDSGWKYANQEEWELESEEFDWGVSFVGLLREGDKVFSTDSGEVTVKSVSDNGTDTVYHLTDVEHTNTYFVEGVLVHNGGGQKR